MSQSPVENDRTSIIWVGCFSFEDNSHPQGSRVVYLVRRNLGEELRLYHRAPGETVDLGNPDAMGDAHLLLLQLLVMRQLESVELKGTIAASVPIKHLMEEIGGLGFGNDETNIMANVGRLRTQLGDSKSESRIIASNGTRRTLTYTFKPLVMPMTLEAFYQELDSQGAKDSSGSVSQVDTARRHAGSLLVFDAWAEAKYTRWIGDAPVQTSCSRRLEEFLLDRNTWDAPRHAVLTGAIASGKSTAILRVVQEARKAKRFDRVLVLPLGLDFSALNELWSRAQAIAGLGTTVTQVPATNRASTLIVVEDAHESSSLEELPWTAQGADNPAFRCFKDFSVLVTCRPHAVAPLSERLATCFGAMPYLLETDSEETADSIVESELSDPHEQTMARTMFSQSGFSLIALTYALLEWKRQERKPKIDMKLAHQAVFAEIHKIAGEISSSDFSDVEVRCLALVWSIGGLDSPVDIDVLRKYFGLELNILGFWRRLVDLRELVPQDSVTLPPLTYANVRHPAWGQLVLHALDESYKSDDIRSGISTDLVRRFLSTPVGSRCRGILFEKRLQAVTPSTCILLALMHSKKGAPDEDTFANRLATYCSGRFLSEEFVQASLLIVELDRNDGADELKLCDRYLWIASNARRIAPSPWSANQSRENLVAAHTAFQAAIQTLRKTFGVDLRSYPKRGFMLYEESYYDYRFGRLDDAIGKLTLSIEAEYEAGAARKPYAAMSRSRLAVLLADQGKYDAAMSHTQLAEKELQEATMPHEVLKMGHRFRGNILLTFGRIHIARREAGVAEEFFRNAAVEYKKADVVPNFELVRARVSIVRGSPESALQLTERFRQNSLIVKDDEMWEQYFRITGDALLMQGSVEDAQQRYKSVLPTPTSDLSTEALIAQDRLHAIASGQTSESIFQSQAV